MANIRNLGGKFLELDFHSPQQQAEVYYTAFLNSELGKIHQCIPWTELAAKFRDMKRSKTKQGRIPHFDIKGQLALMFLKSYTQLSDKELIANLNANYQYQFFCGVYLRPDEAIGNYKIVSSIRCHLARQLNLHNFQQILTDSWRPHLKETNIMLVDATCYETSLRHPSRVKLLWECCAWIYGQMKRLNKLRKGCMPRSKFKEQKAKYLAYQRRRKKTHKDKMRRIRSLLYLLNKLLGQLTAVEASLPLDTHLPNRYYQRRKVITKILGQQQEGFHTGTVPKDLIVSIDKDYIRPIVRGKETRRVEFGAKVNALQIDGINFIEHLSFGAFHEGNRLQNSITHAQQLMHRKMACLAADAIYATNANRKVCTKAGIRTNFKRKGRAGKHETHRKQMAAILAKERSTRLEGSFGTEKEHYGLKRIRARTEPTEILWIVFGIHTANAVRVAKKKFESSTTANSPPLRKAA